MLTQKYTITATCIYNVYVAVLISHSPAAIIVHNKSTLIQTSCIVLLYYTYKMYTYIQILYELTCCVNPTRVYSNIVLKRQF